MYVFVNHKISLVLAKRRPIKFIIKNVRKCEILFHVFLKDEKKMKIFGLFICCHASRRHILNCNISQRDFSIINIKKCFTMATELIENQHDTSKVGMISLTVLFIRREHDHLSVAIATTPHRFLIYSMAFQSQFLETC